MDIKLIRFMRRAVTHVVPCTSILEKVNIWRPWSGHENSNDLFELLRDHRPQFRKDRRSCVLKAETVLHLVSVSLVELFRSCFFPLWVRRRFFLYPCNPQLPSFQEFTRSQHAQWDNKIVYVKVYGYHCVMVVLLMLFWRREGFSRDPDETIYTVKIPRSTAWRLDIPNVVVINSTRITRDLLKHVPCMREVTLSLAWMAVRLSFICFRYNLKFSILTF